jgi:hypothetical protein
MGADIGYLQTKIRDLNSKFEKIESEMGNISNKFDSFRRTIEEKEKKVNATMDKVINITSQIDQDSLRLEIKNIMNDSKEVIVNKIKNEMGSEIEKSKDDLNRLKEEIQNIVSKNINNIEKDIKEEFADTIFNLYKNFFLQFGHILKEASPKVLDLDPLMLPIPNFYNNEDIIVLMDWKKDSYTCDRGRNLISKKLGKMKYKIEDTNDPNFKIGGVNKMKNII